MPTAQIVLRDLLRVHVAPTLRERSFAGSGQDFHRLIDRNWAAINIQRDSYSTADEVRFTVNLGTASTAVRSEDGFAPDEPAREVLCHWRTRVGVLLPNRKDTWWSVRARMAPHEIERLGMELAGHLSERVVPRLEAMAPDEAILATVWDGEPRPGLAPAAMDVIGPILRRIGPQDRFKRYLAVLDSDGETSASLYTMFDTFPPAALGPARIAKRLEKLSAKGFEPRQQAIMDLGYTPPNDTIMAAIRPALDDPDQYIRFAAAQALGRLGDASVRDRLEEMVGREPPRFVAVHAAFALARMDGALSKADRQRTRDVIAARRDRAVGHDRAALSQLLRTLGPA